MKKILFILAFALIGATACQNPNTNNGDDGSGAPAAFLNMSTEGAFLNGAVVFEKDEARHQIAVNPKRWTYRIQDDEQNESLQFVLNSLVTEIGKPSSILIRSSGVSSVESGTYAVVLSQLKDGKAWYWCKDKKMGFLMPSF